MKRLVCYVLSFSIMLLSIGSTALALTEREEEQLRLAQLYPELDDWDISAVPAWADDAILPALAPSAPEVSARAALLMEKETGRILFASNEREKLPFASVTKVMTLLLIFEALDKGVIRLEDKVQISQYAQGMGGSQCYMQAGETYSVSDMLKGIVVASGNDASVAMAEYLAGSEESFVARMNQRASELGMSDTTFRNCTGLPEENHLSSARDIAIMSRELILNHPSIRQYTTIWMDSLRDGTFTLANTNKLVRFYKGATGLKTGSTSLAKFCVSATAERDGMEMISVILGADNSDIRFEGARKLLDFGFANYSMAPVHPDEVLLPVPVVLGEASEVQPVLSSTERVLVDKMRASELTKTVTLAESVAAPVEVGQILGELTVKLGDEVIKTVPIVASAEVKRLGFWQIFGKILRTLLMA